MGVEVLPYTLPDAVLYEEEGSLPAMIWQPHEQLLVLGASNKPEQSLYTDYVIRDQIPVYKRPSGGESVILTPNTLVISIRTQEAHRVHPHAYFKKINAYLIDQLQKVGVKGLHYRGISDIAIGNKKILGSSIYRKKGIVFYHAVLNVAESVEVISRYLKHPTREPDYRKGRDHRSFVTSLKEAGYPLDPAELSRLIQPTDQFFERLNGSPYKNPYF